MPDLIRTGYTHDYFPDPRLSATKLAEYLQVNATGRSRILREAKFPAIAPPQRYAEARRVVLAHLAGEGGEHALDNALARLERKRRNDDLSDFELENCRLCTDAIDAYRVMISDPAFSKISFERNTQRFSKLSLSGVSIALPIDLMTRRTDRNGNNLLGAAALIFLKTAKIETAARLKACSLLVYETLKRHTQNEDLYDPTMCIAIDVFGQAVYRAKGEQKGLLRTVESSCDEVKARWPSVTPPKSYNGPPID